jgi:inorganic triphosphatase YgiF
MSEVESAFLILTKDRIFILEKIKNVILNSGFNHEKKEIKNIHDLYFDTSDDCLLKNQIELRIRLLDDSVYKITLKALKNRTKNYSDRVEIEEPWSEKSFYDIMNKLKSLGIKLSNFEHCYDKIPNKALDKMGLKNIQNKKTNREIINAVNKSSKQIEFEFALDHTMMLINSNYKFRFTELEIESKASGNEAKFEKFVNEFTKNPEFKSWSHDKLETGLAIKNLFESNSLKKNIDYDENGDITINGINKIDDFLRS